LHLEAGICDSLFTCTALTWSRNIVQEIGVDASGSEQSKGRSLYDLTFSAPKSVSIQALVGGDERLIAAHDKAVREALAEAENYAAARVRLKGANEDLICSPNTGASASGDGAP